MPVARRHAALRRDCQRSHARDRAVGPGDRRAARVRSADLRHAGAGHRSRGVKGREQRLRGGPGGSGNGVVTQQDWRANGQCDCGEAMSKSGTRRKSRELALQMLFQLDMGKQTTDDVRKTFWSERKDLDEKVRGFADDLFRVASERRDEIDQIIERNAEHWRMDRMAAVDRNLLRAGVAEFLGFPQTPRPVVINESLEIARRYSTPESVQFINGVLDSVARELGESKSK